MLNIHVVDVSAESRNQIIAEINGFIQRDIQDNFLIPRLNIKPLAISEIKFHAAPDICIVGHEIAAQELSMLGDIRKLLPESAIVVRTKANLENISIFEQFARLGVDDTFAEGISALEFFKKIILLTKRGKKAKSGQLIVVEGSKGGQGTTSVVAAMGEILHEQGKRVLLVDLDSETQDLSRFLMVKPFINENLQYLVDQHRPISEETVLQCTQAVWQGEDTLFCMPPIADSDELYDSRSSHSKIYLSIFDVLDRLFDYVIVDIGSMRGNMARTLYRVADTVLCLVNNDPAALYAASSKISSLRGHMSVNASIKVMECAPYKHSLPSSLVRNEISRSAKLDADSWLPQTLPYCSHANKWPGSGSTLYSSGSRGLKKALNANLLALGYLKNESEGGIKLSLGASTNYLRDFIRKEKPLELPQQTEKKLLGNAAEISASRVSTSPVNTEKKDLLELPSPDQIYTAARLVEQVPYTDLHTESEGEIENEHEPLVSNVRIN